jgi:hypothetical protein
MRDAEMIVAPIAISDATIITRAVLVSCQPKNTGDHIALRLAIVGFLNFAFW